MGRREEVSFSRLRGNRGRNAQTEYVELETRPPVPVQLV